MLSRRIRIVTALAVLALASCGEDPIPPDRFTFSLALDNGIDGSCDMNATCDGFPITCGAIVGVRLLDLPEVGPAGVMSSPVEREAACVRVPADETNELTLCDLARGRLQVNFERVPRASGMIEIVVWPDTEPTAVPSCPTLSFDLNGRVRTDQFDPINADRPAEPSFARRQYFNFGGQTETATVELGCHNPDLVGPSCRPISTYVKTFVVNLNSPALSIDDDTADNLDVRIGQPSSIGKNEFEIGETFPLNPAVVIVTAAPFFERIFSFAFNDDDDVCVLVRDMGPQTTTATHCTRVIGGESLDLDGYLVSKRDLENLLVAAGLDEFPLDGFVIGRVLGAGEQPVSGVSIIPNNGSQVLYVGEDMMTSTEFGVTSNTGYFISTNAPFSTLWSAERGDGLVSQFPPPRGGLLADTVSVVILRMSQE